MPPRLLALLPAIVLLATSGGCFTTGWTRTMRQKIEYRLEKKKFSPGPEGFGMDADGYGKRWDNEYYKLCDHLEPVTVDGARYHRYACPNLFHDAAGEFLEILVPDARSEGPRKAIVRSVNHPSVRRNAEDLVYARYLTGGNATADPELAREAGPRSLRGRPYATEFPSLLTLRLDHETGEFSLWFAQRLDRTEYPESRLDSLGERQSRHYHSSCPPYGGWREGDARVDGPHCELWYESGQIWPSGDVEATGKGLWKVARALGYLVTVPLDIVTAPFQGIAILIVSAASGHH